MTTAREASHRLSSLLRDERNSLAEFLVALAAFDAERGWAALGYGTLHQYLERELKLTGGPAYYRRTAAHLIQRFPSVIEPLRDGRICLTVVGALAAVLTTENEHELLPRFFGLSRDKAEALVAELRPRPSPPRREVVTVPPSARPERSEAESKDERARPPCTASAAPERTSPVRSERVQPLELSAPELPSRERDVIDCATGDLRRLHVTVSSAFVAKLKQAKAAVSHSIPDGDTEAVLSAALDLLLEKAARNRALVKNPRPQPTNPSDDPRHIPAAVARAVFQRDGGRCQCQLPSGEICGSTWQLELDHIVPVARGGRSTVANLRVVCRAHNDLEARRTFGDAWMDAFARGRAEAAPAPTRDG